MAVNRWAFDERPVLECKRCHYRWQPDIRNQFKMPVKCAGCHSKHWDKDYKYLTYGGDDHAAINDKILPTAPRLRPGYRHYKRKGE